VDIKVEDGDRLELGSLSYEVLAHAGHAKDLVSVMLPGRLLTADCALDRLVRQDGPPERQRGPPVPHPLLHLPRPAHDLLVYPGTTTRTASTPL
jgi:glyoxylase-like metal-dependent hydrolase (beta-lactamase superfamily II)